MPCPARSGPPIWHSRRRAPRRTAVLQQKSLRFHKIITTTTMDSSSLKQDRAAQTGRRALPCHGSVNLYGVAAGKAPE